MKKKISNLKAYYNLHPKRFWVIGIILVLVIVGIATHKPEATTTIVSVSHGDLKQTVLATGQVTSETDLDLAFSSAGLVRSLSASVGSRVYKGQVLAALDNGSEYAALKSAQANYQKVVDGNSNEEVAVAQASLQSAKTNLDNTQKVQGTLVANARRALLNTDLKATLSSGSNSTAPTVSGLYTGSEEGTYKITLFSTGSGGSFNYSGLENGTSEISTIKPTALGTQGLFIQFPSDYNLNSNNAWIVSVPNKQSSTYLTSYNAYQNAQKASDSAIAAAQDAVAQAEANLGLKKAAARPADVAVAQAQVDQASAVYEKTVLRAPAGGTVVHVDIKVGERVDAQKPVVVIQDVGSLYVEADINEANIAKVALGQPVVMTLDAFGPEAKFTGTVVHVDPSSTTTDGIANYQIKVSIKDESGLRVVRPGMNANILITAWDKPGVISVPKAAVTTTDGVSTIEVVTNEKKNKTETRTVTLGAIGDGNLVEVTAGLSDGEKIAVKK